MSLLKTSKIQMALVLIVFAIWVIFVDRVEGSFLSISTSVLVCVLTDILFTKIRRTPFFFPSAAIVSGLIIGLISPPQMYEYIVVASIIAITLKNLIRISNRHIFNPAASGLLISSLIFNQSVAWSGAPVFLFIFPAFVSLIRVRRYYTIIAFLIIYTVSLMFLNPPAIQDTKYFILNTIIDPTILFFSLVMLPEPMTSPHNHQRQIQFGVLIAVLIFLISSPILNSQFSILNSFDPLLTSLLLANAVFFKFR